MTLTISTAAEWTKLKEQNLTTFVDPMVLRCGEIFLNGAKGVRDPESAWELLNANIHAIWSFFDALILNENLPVVNYGDTFDAALNFDQRVLTRINHYEEVLYDVDVGYEPYQEIKQAALQELSQVYREGRNRNADLVQDILSELAAAEYAWSPSIGDLEHELDSEEQKKLAAFLIGGLIFGGYAQVVEGEHLIQPKRSRLFLAVSLDADRAYFGLEKNLFENLKKNANTACEDLPWFPTFFPYLLDRARTPGDVIREVVNLRESGAVADYRHWLREVMRDWKENGKVSSENKKEVRTIEQSIAQSLGASSLSPNVEVKVTLANVVTPEMSASISPGAVFQRFWGWILGSLPGKRYRKLLTRAIIADSEYVQIEKRVKAVWSTG